MIKQALFKIGYAYIHGCRPNTIVDIYETYNSKGELVRRRYVSEHNYLGQTVTDYDVPEATIARAEPVGGGTIGT